MLNLKKQSKRLNRGCFWCGLAALRTSSEFDQSRLAEAVATGIVLVRRYSLCGLSELH